MKSVMGGSGFWVRSSDSKLFTEMLTERDGILIVTEVAPSQGPMPNDVALWSISLTDISLVAYSILVCPNLPDTVGPKVRHGILLKLCVGRIALAYPLTVRLVASTKRR